MVGIVILDVYIDYLMVVLGVRINNIFMLISSLKSVVVKNLVLVKKVVIDFEFVKYYMNVDFMSIVK